MEVRAIPLPPKLSARDWLRVWSPVLILGLLAFALPTMIFVAKVSWSTEQGAHGPIVLATGLWLIARERQAIRAFARPGSAVITAVLLAGLLPLYAVARITGIIEIEAAAMYATLLVVAYALIGLAALRQVWFPIVYMLFMFPPPDSLFAILTQPLKIMISQWAVGLLHVFDYPVAGSGVTIQIGQYQMLVAAACAGLNSLMSLSALGLFYSYIRHNSNWRYMLVLVACIVPIAVVANLIRVLILLLVTYHLGEAAGQGFLHELAGMTMFMSALIGIFLLDWLGTPLRNAMSGRRKS